MNDPKIGISLSISERLLKRIENNVQGKNRSEKIAKCMELGYKILNGE